MSGLDWPGMMRAGLSGLRLTPDQFWGLTPGEFMLMIGRGAQAAPMGRARLQDLLDAFPDDPGGTKDDGL